MSENTHAAFVICCVNVLPCTLFYSLKSHALCDFLLNANTAMISVFTSREQDGTLRILRQMKTKLMVTF